MDHFHIIYIIFMIFRLYNIRIKANLPVMMKQNWQTYLSLAQGEICKLSECKGVLSG